MTDKWSYLLKHVPRRCCKSVALWEKSACSVDWTGLDSLNRVSAFPKQIPQDCYSPFHRWNRPIICYGRDWLYVP